MSQVIQESLAAIDAAIDDCADNPLYGLSDTELVELLQRLDDVTNKLHGAITVPLLAEADGRDLGRRNGASSTQAWVRQVLRWAPGKATSLVRLAAGVGVDGRLAVTGKAMQAGEISPEAGAAIGRSMQKLPHDVDPDERALAEQTLVEHAKTFDPKTVEKLGDRIYEVIAPDDADKKLAQRLAKEERRALLKRWLTISPTGIPGVEQAKIRLDTETMAKLREALDPLSAPRPSTPEGPDLRPFAQRQADAFADVINAYLRETPNSTPDSESTPDTPDAAGGIGGTRRLRRPRLLVTVALNLVAQKLGIGTLDTGQRLSPQAMARLACEAEITPIYLDPNGNPLHVGSKTRFFGDRDRNALTVRDRGCTFPGCDRKPRWCDAHHVTAYRISGHTKIQDGCLLCSYHHHLIHQGEWTVRMAPDGLPEFIPRYGSMRNKGHSEIPCTTDNTNGYQPRPQNVNPNPPLP